MSVKCSLWCSLPTLSGTWQTSIRIWSLVGSLSSGLPVLLTTPLGSLRQAGPHLKCKVKSLQQGHTQPSTSLDHRGSHTLNCLPFCLQRFESIFRVLYFPFLFKNKNCLRYIEFCFGRTRCVFPTLRPLVLSLAVSVCLAGSLHCCMLHASEDCCLAGAHARFLSHSLVLYYRPQLPLYCVCCLQGHT